MILLTHLLLFHQYVNELLAGYSHSSYFGTARSYSKNNIQQRDNQSTGYNQPLPMSIIPLISQFPKPPRPMAFLSPVENIGVEPMTSCLQSRRSSQLS